MIAIRERKLSVVFIVSHAMMMMIAFSPSMIEGLPLGGSLMNFLNNWLGINDSQSIGNMPPTNGSPCFPPAGKMDGTPTSTAWHSQRTDGNTVVKVSGSKSSSSSSYTSHDPPLQGSSGTDCGDFSGMGAMGSLDNVINSSGLDEIGTLATNPFSSGDNLTQASNTTGLSGGINPGGATVPVSDAAGTGDLLGDGSLTDLGADLYGSQTADGAGGNLTTTLPIDGGGTNMGKNPAAASTVDHHNEQVNSYPGGPETGASLGSYDPSPMPSHDDGGGGAGGAGAGAGGAGAGAAAADGGGGGSGGGGGGKAASTVQPIGKSDKLSSSPDTQSSNLSVNPGSIPSASDNEESCGDDEQQK